ncbi:hypothetical protein [Kribbella sp. DT2]|uniref:hypothetical protein n=1 Tax=Kribbella sp. DT2 TaxID=3393427 RepID=UPI003CF47552
MVWQPLARWSQRRSRKKAERGRLKEEAERNRLRRQEELRASAKAAVEARARAEDPDNATVNELVRIGLAGGFLDGGPGQERTRELGRMLDSVGGIEEMRAFHREVASRLPDPAGPRELERAWDHIGKWWG